MWQLEPTPGPTLACSSTSGHSGVDSQLNAGGCPTAPSASVDPSACSSGDGGPWWWQKHRKLQGPLRLTPRKRLHSKRRLCAIIGQDDRSACPIKQWPFSAVGQLDVEGGGDGDSLCSGVLIGPNKVLTAAHCVWDYWNGGFFSSLSFAAGRYNSSQCAVTSPWGVVPWQHVTIFKSYADGLAPDVAVVHLEVPIGMHTGWVGVKASACTPGGDLDGEGHSENASFPPRTKALPVCLAGYPAAAPSGMGAFASGQCMKSCCKVDVCNSGGGGSGVLGGGSLIHTCDTLAGQSGSPMLDAHNYVRLVHSTGVVAQFVGSAQDNSATLITKFILDNVHLW